MDEKLFDVGDIKSVLRKVGIESKECDQCMGWTSPKLEAPLTNKDKVLGELTLEEQGFLRCMGYILEEKVIDPLKLIALHETFWTTVRSLHDLPSGDLTVKEGKYIVEM